ncbi:MAG TPA: M20/M25/M40 family metallo-hydrolase [Dehalococcoidia bacterium]|nr:M20/M25/M40 family metallo-hydrolase [Dehalococcoidia bacterium]
MLSVDIGPRAAGSDAEKRAAEYLQDQLSSFGYEASLQPFTFDSFTDLGTSLGITSPESRAIQAVALGASDSAVAEGSLVAAGLGRPQEIPLGARGSVLLVERGDITFSAKVANAEAAGAIGVIVYNNREGVVNGRLTRPGGIPAAGISQADGQALAALLAGGPVTVRLETKTETRTATSQNVVATPPDGVCSIVAGGHYDSVPEGPGANDNASGTAVVLEMARTRAANQALDDVCYVLFGSEEIGLVGSGEYVQSLTSEQVDRLDAMLNFDMLAVGNEWPFIGSPEITALAAANADRLGIAYTVEPELPENVGSDHINFVEAGVPSIIFNCFCDDHYHSPQDTFEFVVPERLSQAGEIGLGIIDDLLNT